MEYLISLIKELLEVEGFESAEVFTDITGEYIQITYEATPFILDPLAIVAHGIDMIINDLKTA